MIDDTAAFRRLLADCDLPGDLAAWAWAHLVALTGDSGHRRTGGIVQAATNDAGRVVGQHHHSAKLSDTEVELILALRDEGLSYAQIAAKHDDGPRPSRSTIAAICTGRRRCQTVMGHRRVYRTPTFTAAHPDEFDVVVR